MESFISECYPSFLADCDRKLVLLGLQCPSVPAATRRKCCPVGFLNDEEEVSQIKTNYKQSREKGKSGGAKHSRSSDDGQYKTKHAPTGFMELQVLVMESTKLRLCPQAWHYL